MTGLIIMKLTGTNSTTIIPYPITSCLTRLERYNKSEYISIIERERLSICSLKLSKCCSRIIFPVPYWETREPDAKPKTLKKKPIDQSSKLY